MTYGRLGNRELEFLETVIAMALEVQRLALAVAELSDDPVALQYAKKSLSQAKELQAVTLEYQQRRREQQRAK